MALKNYKPTTPSMRYTILNKSDEITHSKPEKSLTKGKKETAGRGNNGRISVRRRGSGHKRKFRTIDYKRDKHNILGVVKTIEYDPNRSAHIALIQYSDGEKRYILAAKGLKVGAKVQSGENVPIEIGNVLPISKIPVGTVIHNVELNLGRGGQLARAAGTSAMIVANEGDYVTVRLSSGEMRMIFGKCCATIGEVGNEDHMNESLGKAGRNRWKGNRPCVRGVAMNPIDHPHGGGEGKTSGGRHPVTPWGQPTRGYKTRQKRKTSSKFIVKRRK